MEAGDGYRLSKHKALPPASAEELLALLLSLLFFTPGMFRALLSANRKQLRDNYHVYKNLCLFNLSKQRDSRWPWVKAGPISPLYRYNQKAADLPRR